MSTSVRWWGGRDIEPGSAGQWTLGPLRLIGERRVFEWRMSWCADREPSIDALEFSTTEAISPHDESIDVSRHALGGDQTRLVLEPALADRPVVARPSMPFSVLGGHTVNLFVSTPLWVKAKLGDGSVLLDVPSLRLSDTWFGETPRGGELCYASRTEARLDPDRLPYHPVRVLTRVSISNSQSEPVVVERVKIPLPHLALFVDKQDHLWTQAVHVERSAKGGLSKIWFETPSFRILDSVEKVGDPRVSGDRDLLERAMHALIG